MQKPTIGRIVVVKGFIDRNGNDESGAMITRNWGSVGNQGFGEQFCINVMIFPDMGEPTPRTSIYLFEDRNQAEAYRAGTRAVVAFWPDRV